MTWNNLPWVPEDIFFLIDTDGLQRSRVNEARSAERQKIIVSSREPDQTVSTVYFILRILRTDLWSQGRSNVPINSLHQPSNHEEQSLLMTDSVIQWND